MGAPHLVFRRLGRVFHADDGPAWMVSHAAYPTPLALGDGRVRVYFTARDAHNRGQMAWLDLVFEDPTWRVSQVGARPIAGPGPRGGFDADGRSTASAVRTPEGSVRLYYLGWTRGHDVAFRNYIGRAVLSDDGHTLTAITPTPCLERSAFDPYTVSYPFAERGSDGTWSMLYGSHTMWTEDSAGMRHTLRRAVSADGAAFTATGETILPLVASDGEYAHARPWIIDIAGVRTLLFARRNPDYRIAAAAAMTRDDGSESWQRAGDIRFVGPEEPWEGGTQTYPAAFHHTGRTYLLYNGAEYGRTGFGLAVLEDGPTSSHGRVNHP